MIRPLAACAPRRRCGLVVAVVVGGGWRATQAVAQMEEMTTDTGREQLEKMRSELVAQVDGAKGEPLVAAQLAMRLRPVVAQLLGEGADDGDEEPASSSAGGGGGATGDAAPAPAPAATEGKKKGGFGLPWGKKNN